MKNLYCTGIYKGSGWAFETTQTGLHNPDERVDLVALDAGTSEGLKIVYSVPIVEISDVREERC